jgi:MFS family permease
MGARTQQSAPPSVQTADGVLDRWRAIIALLWLGFVGIATFQLIPLLTDQLADVYHFGDAKAGLVSSWYCGAGFIASVIAFWWLPRWDRRPVLFVVLVAGLLGEATSLFTHSYAALAAGRVVTGFAAASITCLVLSAITRSRRAEHLYGLYTATISLCAAAAFITLSYALPAMRDALGDGALFFFFVCVWVAGLVAAAFVPRGTTSDRAPDAASAEDPSAPAASAATVDAGLGAGVVRGEARQGLKIFSPGVLVLIASPVVFYIANGGSWAFVGRVGTWTGLSDGQVGIALAISNVCAILGGLVASWQGLRFRVVGPLVLGIMLTMSANLIMVGRWGMAGYSIANFIGFGFTVYTVAMYLQAFGYVDPSGRLMASGGLALYGGGALGPVILAQFIPAGDNPSYVVVLIADAVIFLIAPLVFIVGWAMVKRALRAGEPAPGVSEAAAAGMLGPDVT